MPIELRLSLSLPRFVVHDSIDGPRVIDSRRFRFVRLTQANEVPKIGQLLSLTTRIGIGFEAMVSSTHWDERDSVTVVDCQYMLPKLREQQYAAIASDPAWVK